MRIVVTAGNTQVLIDRVRCITNIFSGRTGTAIALTAQRRGHDVTLITSHPEVVGQLADNIPTSNWHVEPYRTFEELESLMALCIRDGRPDAVVHCAAVSDFRSAGIYAPSEHTHFRPDGRWESDTPAPPAFVDRGAGKIKSDVPELWLRLVRTPKLVDQVRGPWAFKGTLVKFKLEVGLDEAELQRVAEASRLQSQADLMVANTLEGASSWALLGRDDNYHRVERGRLAEELLTAIESH